MIFDEHECIIMPMTQIHNLVTGEISFSPKIDFDGIYMDTVDVGCCDLSCRHISHNPGVSGWTMYTIDKFDDVVWIDCSIAGKRILLECTNNTANLFYRAWSEQVRKYNERTIRVLQE